MKKLIAALLVLGLLVSAAFATQVSYVPSPGIKAWNEGQSDMYGKIAYDRNGQKFRYVLNSSGQTMEAKYAAYYKIATNDYTVTTFEGYYNQFAGIWYCNASGDTKIQPAAYGWIQISGIAVASVEGTTDIAAGDILVGTAGQKYLVRGMGRMTSLLTNEVGLLGPIATSAWTTNAVTYESVILRSSY